MGELLGALNFIRERLNEPSSHAALAALFAMTGHQLDEGALQSLLNIATFAFGVAAFFIKEVKPQTEA